MKNYTIKTKETIKKVVKIVEVPSKEMKVDLSTYIGFRIKEIRTEKGINQNQLAEALGLTRTSICNIESGRHSFSIKTLEIFCSKLNIKSIDILPF